MELLLVKDSAPEWDYMWNWLSQHPINANIDEPTLATNDGESWQYMGSYQFGTEGVHSFRHRNHPTAGLITVNVRANEHLTEENTINRVKVK